jgi:hypothetical protein
MVLFTTPPKHPFGENLQLLRETEYQVRSKVPATSFCEFSQFVKGPPSKLTTENINVHSALNEEFGFQRLFDEYTKATSNKVDNVLRLG